MLHDAGVGVPREKVRHADGSVTVVTRLGKGRVTDHDVFQTVVSWLQSAPLTPRLQAALYEMLAGLPGVRYQGPATEADGALLSDRLVLNPATGKLLAAEQVVARPAPRSNPRGPHDPAGTVLSAQACLAGHWTGGPGPGGWPTNPPGVVAPKG
jgi:hypothetical protein